MGGRLRSMKPVRVKSARAAVAGAVTAAGAAVAAAGAGVAAQPPRAVGVAGERAGEDAK